MGCSRSLPLPRTSFRTDLAQPGFLAELRRRLSEPRFGNRSASARSGHSGSRTSRNLTCVRYRQASCSVSVCVSSLAGGRGRGALWEAWMTTSNYRTKRGSRQQNRVERAGSVLPRRFTPLAAVIAGVLVLSLGSPSQGANEVDGIRRTPETKRSFRPPSFRLEPNAGRFDRSIRYVARGPRTSLYLTAAGATLAFRSRGGSGQRHFVTLGLLGGQDVEPEANSVLPGTINYFVGRDRSKWRTGMQAFGRVSYPGVLPGVDVAYHGADEGGLEYDVTLAPGVDPAGAIIAMNGVDSLEIAADDVVLRLPGPPPRTTPRPLHFKARRELDPVLMGSSPN